MIINENPIIGIILKDKEETKPNMYIKDEISAPVLQKLLGHNDIETQ